MRRGMWLVIVLEKNKLVRDKDKFEDNGSWF